jgi:hypothetical protein
MLPYFPAILFLPLVLRFATAIVMEVAYGHQIISDGDPYVKISHDTGDAVQNAGSPGSTPVDFFPFREFFSHAPT